MLRTVRLVHFAADNPLVALALIRIKLQAHAARISCRLVHTLEPIQHFLAALRLLGLLPCHIAPDKLFLAANFRLLLLVSLALLFQTLGFDLDVSRVVSRI